MNSGTLSRELRLPGINLVVGEPIKGYILCRDVGHIFDVTRLGVVSFAQGFGLGRQLLQAVLALAHTEVMLTVRKDNARALRLYHGMGFQIVGHIEQAWFMSISPPRSGIRELEEETCTTI